MTKITLRKSARVLLCTIPLLCISPFASAEWISNADVSVRHDNNINNAELENERAGVNALNAGASATAYFPLEDGNSVGVSGEARGETFDRYTGLNNVSLGAALALRKKWGLGLYAPWTAVSLSSAHLNYANSIRNGWRNQLALRGGKRLLDRWSIRAEYMIERRTAKSLPPDQPGISGDVFSQNSRNLALNAEYLWDESTFLTGGLLLRRGDVVATTSETLKILSASDAIALDPVFGPHFYAYRMNGTTYGLNMDLNFSLTTHSLLRASMARYVTHAAGENNYAKNVQMFSWNYNY